MRARCGVVELASRTIIHLAEMTFLNRKFLAVQFSPLEPTGEIGKISHHIFLMPTCMQVET